MRKNTEELLLKNLNNIKKNNMEKIENKPNIPETDVKDDLSLLLALEKDALEKLKKQTQKENVNERGDNEIGADI